MCARLVGFVDYGNAAMLEHDVVLIRSGPLFLQYNRAKDYNIDNPVADRVTITEAYSDDSFSYSLAALAQGESYSYPNFDEAGNSLVVEVCTMFKEPLGVLDFADISIFVNDGKRESSCPPDTGHKSASQVSADKGLKFSDPVRTGLFIGLMCTFVLIMCTCLNLFCVVCSRKCGKPGSDSTKSVNDGEGLEDSAVIIDKNATECPRTSITPFKAVTITV